MGGQEEHGYMYHVPKTFRTQSDGIPRVTQLLYPLAKDCYETDRTIAGIPSRIISSQIFHS